MSQADELPPRVRALVRDHLRTPLHLEVLLTCVRDGAPWTLARVAAAHHAGESETRAALQDLVDAGLLLADPAGALACTFSISWRDAALEAAVAELARAYETHPLELLRAVYERSPSPMRRFGEPLA